MSSIDGKVLGSDEGIKLGSTYGKVVGTILDVYMESHFVLILEHIWDP